MGNHRCVFCGYSNMRRKKVKCDKSLMMNILEDAYALGTREVGFYLVGEPLMCNDIEDYIAKAKTLG